MKMGEAFSMSVHFGSHGRRRAAVAVVAVAVAVALLLAYTIISTRKATDDVIANVSEVYLGELSKQLVFHFDTGVENKFSQLETVASGLEMAAPESREQTVDYLQAQAGNDDYAFLAVRTASGEFVSADGEVRPCDGDGGELPAYYDAQGRRVVLYDDKIVLVDDIEPLRCGDDTIVAAVCGFSSLGVGDRLNLTLFDGFSRSIMIDRDGMCVVSDRNSGLDSGESLFALIDERGSFVGGSSEEERIRSVLASGGTVNVPIVFDGRSEYLYFYPLGHAEWYMCTVMPYSVIEGDIGDLSGTIAANAAIVGAAVLLFVLLVFLLYYRMARRNTRLLAEEKDRAERAFAEAQQASLAKTEFLSRMSHEIRTPMNGIMGMTAIALESIGDDGKVRTCLEKVTLSSEHLLSLINDMLQMSKLEDGEYVISREWVDLNELLRDVLTIVSQRAAEVGVTMTYDRNADWVVYPYIYASPLHVRQLFLNIYGNCIKYNHVGGRVDTVLDCMGVENGKVTYRWTISDTGVGMSEDFLQHIFEPFAQENSDARSVYQGTGLGMAIAKSLADKMGGDIRVTSEKGKGSVFVVTLAFEIAEEKRSEETSAAADIAGLRLLLAEDNELNAEIAERLLSDEGARIVMVRDGQKAVETFRDQPPGTFDAILMDVMMPVMDGFSATRAIREMDRPDAKTIPIIAMTASAFEEDAQRCMKAGMNAHIPKPLQMERVLTTIAKCCRH